MKLQRKILFPTPVYFKDLPNAKELNKYLFKEIKKWRKADPEGEKKTNSGFGWHSKTDMDKRKEYQPLINELFKMAEECNLDYGIQPKLGLGNMWANINPTYSYNKTHTLHNCSGRLSSLLGMCVFGPGLGSSKNSLPEFFGTLI